MISEPTTSFCSNKNLKLSIGFLLLLIIILLSGLVTLLVLYLNQLHSDSVGQKSPQILTEKEFDKNICASAQCVEAAAEILNSLDPEIDPCEDFYGFACNGWIQNNPIPKVLKQKYFYFIFISSFVVSIVVHSFNQDPGQTTIHIDHYTE